MHPNRRTACKPNLASCPSQVRPYFQVPSCPILPMDSVSVQMHNNFVRGRAEPYFGMRTVNPPSNSCASGPYASLVPNAGLMPATSMISLMSMQIPRYFSAPVGIPQVNLLPPVTLWTQSYQAVMPQTRYPIPIPPMAAYRRPSPFSIPRPPPVLTSTNGVRPYLPQMATMRSSAISLPAVAVPPRARAPASVKDPANGTGQAEGEISHINNDVRDDGEESLSAIPERTTCRALLGGNAYRRRNVYKAIIKRMQTHVVNNREEITDVLTREQYSSAAIEKAFGKVALYSEMESTKGEQKRSQSVLKRMVMKKSVYTFILKETLQDMINDWNNGQIGRVSRKNLRIYSNVCNKLYKETRKLLGLDAPSNTQPSPVPEAEPVANHD